MLVGQDLLRLYLHFSLLICDFSTRFVHKWFHLSLQQFLLLGKGRHALLIRKVELVGVLVGALLVLAKILSIPFLLDLDSLLACILDSLAEVHELEVSSGGFVVELLIVVSEVDTFVVQKIVLGLGGVIPRV